MTVSPQIPSDRDLELLSAYLDGELTDREKEKLEQRLARENALRAVMDDLRETVTLVSDLPRLKAPRSFTLDPAVYGRTVGRPVPWWQRLFTLESALQLSGALGAAASILLIILAVLFTQEGSEKSSMSAERPASESSQVAMQPTLAESEAEETALAYAGNDLLQTTMAAQNTYYATHQAMTPTLAPTQAALSMAAPAGEESFQDTTTAPTEDSSGNGRRDGRSRSSAPRPRQRTTDDHDGAGRLPASRSARRRWCRRPAARRRLSPHRERRANVVCPAPGDRPHH